MKELYDLMNFAVVLQELTWKCILRVLSRMLNGIEEILSEISHSPMILNLIPWQWPLETF